MLIGLDSYGGVVRRRQGKCCTVLDIVSRHATISSQIRKFEQVWLVAYSYYFHLPLNDIGIDLGTS